MFVHFLGHHNFSSVFSIMARTKTAAAAESIIKDRVDAEKRQKFLFPTGSRMLNLACSDSIKGGYIPGTVINVIGDSSSGKSFLQMSMCAELCHDDFFDDYDIIYDDVEHALSFDSNYLFGEKTASRIKAPQYDEDDLPCYSDTVEDFRDNVLRLCKEGKKFVYILDSQDSLTSNEEQKAAQTGDGSYNMQKPKIIGQTLRMIVKALKDTSSLLVIVSQTRDNIGFGAMFKPKTRSGGRALDFYSSHVIWTAVVETLKKKERKIGVRTEAKVTKNRSTGKPRDVRWPIYYDFGIDDVGSCIDYLVAEKHWKMNGKIKIIVPEFNFEGGKQALIAKIENDGLERRLYRIVDATWKKAEEDVRLKRKSKFS